MGRWSGSCLHNDRVARVFSITTLGPWPHHVVAGIEFVGRCLGRIQASSWRSSLGDPVVTAVAHSGRNDRVLPRRPWISCQQRGYVPACRSTASCLRHDRSLEADALAVPGMRAVVSHHLVVRERVRAPVRALRSADLDACEKTCSERLIACEVRSRLFGWCGSLLKFCARPRLFPKLRKRTSPAFVRSMLIWACARPTSA